MGETAECLRAVAKGMTLVTKEWDGIVAGMMGIPFPPVLDGHFFTDSPARALARKNFKRTQVLLGENKDEGHFFNVYYLSDILKNKVGLVSLYIQSRMIAPPGWAPLQSKQSVSSLIVLSDWSSLN